MDSELIQVAKNPYKPKCQQFLIGHVELLNVAKASLKDNGSTLCRRREERDAQRGGASRTALHTCHFSSSTSLRLQEVNILLQSKFNTQS